MRGWILALCVAVLLAGCATVEPSVPAGYSGPVATIKDSYTSLGVSTANLFYLNKINGREIGDALQATRGASFGHGFALTAVAADRKVPAQSAAFHIVGRTAHAAPIQSMTLTEYQVIGDVYFSPQANHVYVVRGEMDSTHSAVWIEDEQTHDVMDKKVEVTGSTALSFFEK